MNETSRQPYVNTQLATLARDIAAKMQIDGERISLKLYGTKAPGATQLFAHICGPLSEEDFSRFHEATKHLFALGVEAIGCEDRLDRENMARDRVASTSSASGTISFRPVMWVDPGEPVRPIGLSRLRRLHRGRRRRRVATFSKDPPVPEPTYEALLDDNKKLTEQNNLWREQVEYLTGDLIGVLVADLRDAAAHLTFQSVDDEGRRIPLPGSPNIADRLRAHADRIEGAW